VFFELREYRTLPGKRDDWVRFMEDLVIPYQMSKGMAILGSFVAEEKDDLYVWIRRFESEEHRERLYKDVYESDHWKNEISPSIPELIDREQIKVTRMEATPKSVIR
jgi:hypothetical protein